MKAYTGEYALYRGEKLIEIGTAAELAELFKVKVETIKFYATPINFKRAKNRNKLVAIRLD